MLLPPKSPLPVEMNGFVYCLCRIMSSYSFRGLHNRFNISQFPNTRGVIKRRKRIGPTTAHNKLTAHPKPHVIWNLSLAVVLSIVILFVVI
ncbi:hypothetical protein SAMN04487902_1122 [Prevotella sp. ne3005]|nr:hypothetical protein SAMN04487902_1122 [Prevotella sp. ne3005]